jgi:hypothetical protein
MTGFYLKISTAGIVIFANWAFGVLVEHPRDHNTSINNTQGSIFQIHD